ncbi:hypothetical protein IFM89_026303 [Coptis chinensis]|uniref:Uncharacterized protein n=1 Tax=Coptis chinensis TaxID=261450 RepID=A0A835I6G5_9MAGN|nr:hypothetical protein IFM89_026303 [Coptis chinensis]
MNRFRKAEILVGVPNLKRKALNSWSAVQDTYFSTKDVFERHKVVFTIATSVGSVLTAWAGYSLRYLHQTKVEERLESIEKAMKETQHIQHDEVKKIVTTGRVSTAACIATAGTSLVIGYGLGLRGGIWYANRRFRKDQQKLLGHIKPRRWRFQFLKRPFSRLRGPNGAIKSSETLQKNATSLPVNNTSVVNG